MRIKSKLCHLSEYKVIVQVTGWVNEQNVGSALAEGTSVEDAEDKAISRLNKRINFKANNINIQPINEDIINKPITVDLPINKPVNTNSEPIDWSIELAAIDCEIERLKWSRDDEINFLEKNLGYKSRNKITNYNDITKYLNLLKKINLQDYSMVVKNNINDLIKESDFLLRDLSWDHIKGREYLQKEFNVSTRKELSEEQLIAFVEKLKLVRNQYLAQ